MMNEDAPHFVEISHVRSVVKRGRLCTQCRKIMPPGTKFEAHTYRMDGEFRSDVTCVRTGDEWECPLRPTASSNDRREQGA